MTQNNLQKKLIDALITTHQDPSNAFKKALKRNDDVKILLNHDKKRELGSTKKGNLELEEDTKKENIHKSKIKSFSDLIIFLWLFFFTGVFATFE